MRNYSPPPDLLRNRVILVTGAGAGIGRAAALAYAAHGATVVLLGRTLRKLEQVYDAIEAAGNPQPAIFPMSLENATAHDFAGLAETLEREFQHLDGLLHNAAELPFLSRIDDYDPEAWDRVLRVNLTAPFLLTQACLPLLRHSADASIIFTADRVGRRGRAYWGAYGVTKFGIEGLMQILADETENSGRIRVSSIDPGPVRTALRARVYPGENPQELATPESLMGAYLYLIGPDSRGVTGQTLDAATLLEEEEPAAS
jgi:NAD(P)-dependent dehydrogenase (short-subunit alcohol dehydrogenase family)